MAKAKLDLPVLTRAELEAAQIACANATEAGRAKGAAEKARDHALAKVFFKMGFLSLDEVKALSPDELAEAIEQRVGKCFHLDKDAFAEFALAKTSQGKYPAWKKELIALNGPAAAAAIEGETATQYSYAVIEALATTPAKGSTFVLAPEPETKGKSKAAAAR
jgi:hypothetical protein